MNPGLRVSVWIGFAALTAAIPVLWLDLREAALGRDLFVWQIVSGLVLFGLYLYQWRLLIDRWRKSTRDAAPRLTLHRHIGTAMVVVFLMHAAGSGFGLSMALVICFVATALIGLVNRYTFPLRNRSAIYLWTGLHLFAGAVMAPLILLHIWVALLFE